MESWSWSHARCVCHACHTDHAVSNEINETWNHYREIVRKNTKKSYCLLSQCSVFDIIIIESLGIYWRNSKILLHNICNENVLSNLEKHFTNWFYKSIQMRLYSDSHFYVYLIKLFLWMSCCCFVRRCCESTFSGFIWLFRLTLLLL